MGCFGAFFFLITWRLCTETRSKCLKKAPTSGSCLTTGLANSAKPTRTTPPTALNFAGALEACRTKFQALMQHHRAKAADATCAARHMRAIERLQNTMSGAAMAYESGFHRH